MIHHRLYWESCVREEETGIYIKDLRIFKDFKLENVYLVDNAVYSFSYQLDNGIPIIPFRDNEEDDQLWKLIKFLPTLAGEKDSCAKLRQNFQMSKLMNSDLGKLQELYFPEEEEKEVNLGEELNEIQRQFSQFTQPTDQFPVMKLKDMRRHSDLTVKTGKEGKKRMKILRKQQSDVRRKKKSSKNKTPYNKLWSSDGVLNCPAVS